MTASLRKRNLHIRKVNLDKGGDTEISTTTNTTKCKLSKNLSKRSDKEVGKGGDGGQHAKHLVWETQFQTEVKR